MSDTTIPANETAQDATEPTQAEPTHDAFQAPLAPEIIDGAAINKAHEDNVRLSLTVLQAGIEALKREGSRLLDFPGHKTLSGAQVAYGRALAFLQAEALAAQDEIARMLPAGL